MGEWDLHRLGEVGLALGGGRPGGAASTDFLYRLGLLLLV
jgi:hypothetical protein